MIKVLLIDDDDQLTAFIKTNLDGNETIDVTCKNNAETGLFALQNGLFNLVVIDVMMPGINGIDTATAIRKNNPDIGILFISSQQEIQTKELAFESGADDYLVKPFHISELLMRIRALSRRSGMKTIEDSKDTTYEIGNYRFDTFYRKLKLQDDEKTLSNKEADILKLLCAARGKTVKREAILIQVWGKTDEYATNSMDVYMSRIRKLLKADPNVKIENVHGLGFTLIHP
jgi:DNA-binding response OmpR family regulator